MSKEKAPTARASHEIRIIGGQWKRTKLKVADKSGLRPTPDRVRETLFNWLGQDMTGWHCVDVFAGTGALGLEAASRGATEVLLVERDRVLCQNLQELKSKLGAEAVRITNGDGISALKQMPAASCDLVFLDPPFDSGLFDGAIAAAAMVIKANGWVYLESPQEWKDADLSGNGLQVFRHLKAGAVHAHLLQRAVASAA